MDGEVEGRVEGGHNKRIISDNEVKRTRKKLHELIAAVQTCLTKGLYKSGLLVDVKLINR